MSRSGRPWDRTELLIVFRLYCHTPFGRLHERNPEIIDLARRIYRTPGAVAMKACNFASLDPGQRVRGIKALTNTSQADRALWDSFLDNSAAIAQEAEAVYDSIYNTDERGSSEAERVRDPSIGWDKVSASLEDEVLKSLRSNFSSARIPFIVSFSVQHWVSMSW